MKIFYVEGNIWRWFSSKTHAFAWVDNMTGLLAATFLDRSSEAMARWLELWVYRDGTLNVVVSSDSSAKNVEHCFPCAPYQIRQVLEGVPFKTSTEEGVMRFHREGDAFVAELENLKLGQAWKHSVPVGELVGGLELVDRMIGQYVA